MAEIGHGLQIVSVSSDHKYLLEESELEQLLLREDVRDLPVVVVSVAGAYRGGKSFLLNFFIRYLSAPGVRDLPVVVVSVTGAYRGGKSFMLKFFIRYLSTPLSARQDGSWLGEDSEPLAGFQWRYGVKATTMGVLMWSEPFVTQLPSGEKVAVLLVDTQGNFDSRSTVRDNSTIFALSTLVSSIQIYNLSHDIKEDDLQQLELFTEYGRVVNANSDVKAFQVLEFLVRDWQFPEDYPYGLVGGDRLLREKLQITEDLANEMKVLREHIGASFEKVSCFLMPHPGFKVLKATFKGNISDIDSEFRAQLKVLVNSLFGPEKLIPKKINGERVKARELFNYFKSYLELFNSDKIPTPTSIATATVKAGLLSTVSEARDIYNKGMDSECGTQQLSVPLVDLKFLHEKYVELARAAYANKKKMGSEEEIAEYLDKLTKDLNERLPQFIQSNQAKIQIAMNNGKEAYQHVFDNVSKDKMFCVHPRVLENIHREGVDAAMKIYDASRKRVTQKVESERTEFMQSFQKQYDLEQKINNQNNTFIVSEIKVEYWRRMQAITALNPPLSDAEFNNKHTDAVEKAFDEFESRRNIPSHYDEDVYKYNLNKEIQESLAFLKIIIESKHKEAMMEAVSEYDSYMEGFWRKGVPCVHPHELEEAHRLGLCRALTKLNPTTQCSTLYMDNDKDETALNKILADRFKNYKKNNENANEVAIIKGYNEFLGVMEDNRRSKVMWTIVAAALAIVDLQTVTYTLPLVGHLTNSKTAQGKAIEKALEVFYDQRRNKNNQSDDPYRQRLLQIMTQ